MRATAQVLLCILSYCLCKALQLLYSSVVYTLLASEMYVHVQQEQEIEVQTHQSETRGLANSVQLSQRELSRAGCRPSEITDCLCLPGEAISGPVFRGGGSHHDTYKDELGSDSGVFGGAGEKEVLESVGSDWKLDSFLGLNLQVAPVDSLTALGESCPESAEALGPQI